VAQGGARPICARHALLVGSVTRDRGTGAPGADCACVGYQGGAAYDGESMEKLGIIDEPR